MTVRLLAACYWLAPILAQSAREAAELVVVGMALVIAGAMIAADALGGRRA